jgi:hypothetical protein
MPYCHEAREIVRESLVDEGVACQQLEALGIGRGNAPSFVGDNVKCHVDRLLDLTSRLMTSASWRSTSVLSSSADAGRRPADTTCSRSTPSLCSTRPGSVTR